MSLLNKKLQQLRDEYPTASEPRKRQIKEEAERIKKAMQWPRFKEQEKKSADLDKLVNKYILT